MSCEVYCGNVASSLCAGLKSAHKCVCFGKGQKKKLLFGGSSLPFYPRHRVYWLIWRSCQSDLFYVLFFLVISFLSDQVHLLNFLRLMIKIFWLLKRDQIGGCCHMHWCKIFFRRLWPLKKYSVVGLIKSRKRFLYCFSDVALSLVIW